LVITKIIDIIATRYCTLRLKSTKFHVTLTFDLFFPKLGHVTGSSSSIYVPTFGSIDLTVF